MAKKLFTTDYFTNIGDAIRTKLGVTNKFKTSEMAKAILNIPEKDQPQLYAPTITVEGDILTITKNENNGAFNNNATFMIAVKDKVYVGTTETTYNLFELTEETGGVHEVKVKQCQTNFQNSEFSNTEEWSHTKNALRITASGGNLKICLRVAATGSTLVPAPDIYYSKNNTGTWISWFNSVSGSSEEITLNDGEYITIYNKKTTLGSNELAFITLSISEESTGTAIATGNIMSLLNNTNSIPIRGLYKFFYGCSKLTKLHNDSLERDNYLTLPCTDLTNYCYSYLFANSGITELPNILPATVMANGCYSHMFDGCTALNPDTTQLNIIRHVETLAERCMLGMFKGCSNLALQIYFPGTYVLANYCYSNMFEGTNIGSPSGFDKTESYKLAEGCFKETYKDCTRLLLTTKVQINITGNVETAAFQGMFMGCIRTLYLPRILVTSTIKENGLREMFSGCTELSVGKIAETGATACIVIPAVVAEDALYQMFYNVSTYHDTGWIDGTPNKGETIYCKLK